ncbi:heme peroxidase [Truncatella angustata]|uniref:Peroxidase n=1 Tax=Truncatella angustata TaxID=152316 RepID=A0A9P8UXW7_9PEZI|nr:heme peroxidase [Truncatella angustata]KAH6660203.1 heme peroxidase [Truncatella angustata]KAH8199931.1 hypothetical protein TruAng_005927 [Truncatella angustata]
MRIRRPALSILLLLDLGFAMFYYPTPQISLLEHILVDNWDSYASNFSSAITPCTNYVTMTGEPSLKSGRTTAAQWMRVAFHDFITGNTTAGTGGIDASIGFETFREENKGSAFNDSFTFWRPFVNEFVPMSDLVALGTVMSVNLCGGKYIPYRPGRVDAIQADHTTGVPEPGTNLEETLAQFGRAGFNQEDSIALTACGHTMGSVHHGGFPEVSPESAVTPNNTNGGVDFDSSRGAFDTRVVHEYIDGTGQMGGPLVSSFNETSRSDLRLFESDGNKTMTDLYNSGEGFQEVCIEVMGRMINTVPSAAKLDSPIIPFSIKPINVTWDFNLDDRIVLSGKIRVLRDLLRPTSPVIFMIGGKTVQLEAEEGRGKTVFGSTGTFDDKVYGSAIYYPFSLPGVGLSNVTSFTVAVGEQETTFPISWGPFIVPSLTSSDGRSVSFGVAIPQTLIDALPTDFEVKIVAPVPQPLTLGPRIVSGSGSWTAKSGSRDGFIIWNGTYEVGQQVTGAVSLHLIHSNRTTDTLIVNAGVAGW